MPNRKPEGNSKKPASKKEAGKSNGGGQERQPEGYQQDPTQKGDRERIP